MSVSKFGTKAGFSGMKGQKKAKSLFNKNEESALADALFWVRTDRFELSWKCLRNL